MEGESSRESAQGGLEGFSASYNVDSGDLIVDCGARKRKTQSQPFSFQRTAEGNKNVAGGAEGETQRYHLK